MATKYAPRQSTACGQTVHVNDIEMYYQEHGAGEPLVLLHGFGGCGQNWQPFVAEFAKRHRLIVVDLRGHGYSTNPANEFTHRQAGSDVFLLLDKLGIDRFSAMGISDRS
jgi:pimeloyl-ACP methyl ester carboxylesterase